MSTNKLFALLFFSIVCKVAIAQNNGYSDSKQHPISARDTLAILQHLKLGNALLEGPNSDPSKALLHAGKADSLANATGYTKGKGLSLLLKANAYQQQENYNEAIACLAKAEPIFTSIQSTQDLIRIYSLRGLLDSTIDLRCLYYEKAIALMKSAGDKQRLINILQEASAAKMLQAQTDRAEEMLRESIRLAEELGIERVHWQYSLIGAIQTQKRQLVEALKNELLAVRIGEQFKDTSSRMSEIYNFTAIVYSRMGKLDEAVSYLQKAIATGRSRDAGLSVQLFSNLANMQIRQNKPREALQTLLILEKNYENNLPLNAKIQMYSRFVRCYTELINYKNAQVYADKLMQYSDNMKSDAYDQLPVFTELNRFLITTGQYEKARKYVASQKLVAKKFNALEQLNTVNYYQFKIDSAAGDLAAALTHYQAYTRTKDSVYNENTTNKLNQLHVEFETERKDREIQLKEKNIQLLVKEAALQKALSDKNSQELALNKQTLELRQKDLSVEHQQVALLTKQTQLQNAVTEKQNQDLVIKQKNIEILQQDNRIQEADLKRASMIRNAIIVGTLLLALILLQVYSMYRMKKKLSIELEAQREEIRKKNNSLQELIGEKDTLLVEKEWLVKEVHHRVKNNLQMMVSLLNSQSAYLSSEDAIAAIRESQRRMHALSLIHQKLYEKDETTINMETYITQLVDYLKDSFNSEHIFFVMDVEPVELDVSRAVPVGLILNEAITNSIKYAFSGSVDGQITITLKANAGLHELTIKDNGAGLPSGYENILQRSLGMKLMKGLAGQVKGVYSIRNNNGVEVTVKFP